MFIKTPRWKKKSIFAYGLCIAGVNKQDCKLNLACLANKVLLEHSHAPSFAIAGCILQCQSSYHRNHMAWKTKNIYYLALYVVHLFPIGLFFLDRHVRISSKAISFSLILLISPSTLKRDSFLTCVSIMPYPFINMSLTTLLYKYSLSYLAHHHHKNSALFTFRCLISRHFNKCIVK